MNSRSIQLGLDGQFLLALSGYRSAYGYEWRNNTIAGSQPLVVSTPGLRVINARMRQSRFEFDKIVLTTSASYVPSGFGPPESPGPGITITPSGTSLVLTWVGGGILQSATNVTGIYTDIIGSSSSWPITPTGGQKYYRVRQESFQS